MAGIPSQQKGMRVLAGMALLVLLISALGAAVHGMLVVRGATVSIGWMVIAAAGGVMSIGVLIFALQAIALKQANTLYRTYSALLDALDEVRRQSEHTHTIAENSSLSDWAKQIVYREKDREYLGDQIRGAFVREDWEAAKHMISDLEQKLGSSEEADAFRKELIQAQQSTESEKVAAAIKRFDEQCAAERWKQANQEMQSLLTQFPNNEQIRGLPDALVNRKQEFKRSLLKTYDEAVHREDLNAAHEILLKLDSYLTSNEVSALKDSARGVFRARLMQMGAKFSLAVSDKRFDEAIKIGEGVVREYPNSRYAHEISEMLPALRQRARS